MVLLIHTKYIHWHTQYVFICWLCWGFERFARTSGLQGELISYCGYLIRSALVFTSVGINAYHTGLCGVYSSASSNLDISLLACLVVCLITIYEMIRI